MKKRLKQGLLILLIIIMVLPLCSCWWGEAVFLEYDVKGIDDKLEPWDLDSSSKYFDLAKFEEFDFAWLEDVLFVPMLSACYYTDADGDAATLPVYVYSESGEEKVRIKRLILKEDEYVWIDREYDEEIIFEKVEKEGDTSPVYEGYFNGGTFLEKDIEVASGKEYELIIEAEIIMENTTVSAKLHYDIQIVQYRRPIMPT